LEQFFHLQSVAVDLFLLLEQFFHLQSVQL
jgi:hypothetical protein